MIKIIRQSYPYYLMKDDTQINQYCVMVKTPFNFYQQISPWYFRYGNCENKYNNILRNATMRILNNQLY